MTDRRTSRERVHGGSRRRHGQHVQVEERRAIMDTFLTTFRNSGVVLLACQAAGIAKSTAYEWAKQNLDGFADEWVAAEDDVNDRIDAELWRQAVLGIEKPTTVAGKREIIREYNFQALAMIARARMPWKYRENYEGVGPPLTGPRAAASANAQAVVNTFVIEGRTKRPEDMTPEEIEAAEDALQEERDRLTEGDGE